MLTACSSSGWGGAGCDGGGDDPPPRATGPDILEGVVGTVVFEKRTIDRAGLLSAAASAEVRSARYVNVEIVLVSGGNLQVIARTVTDGDGRYGIGGTFPDGFQVAAYPESPRSNVPSVPVRVQDLSANRLAVVSSPQTAVRPGDRVVVDVRASVTTTGRLAGAFNIVDAIQRGALIWTAATGIEPSPAVVNWESGGLQEDSCFNSATNEITLVGGNRANLDGSDTDEFDDTVIVHEYMHFLVHNHAHSSTPGGRHSGEDLLPTLAFDEGLADWFGALVSGRSLYQDTIGNLDQPLLADCRVCDDLESSSLRAMSGIAGIGSEQSIYEILWDLVDGFPGEPADADGDSVAISSAELLLAVTRLDPRTDYVYVLDLISRLLGAGAVSSPAVQSLLTFPVDQNISFPPVDRDVPSSGRDVFPIPLRVGQIVQGAVDATSAPNPESGFDSVRYYELVLAAGRSVTITLTVDPLSGTLPDRLVLELLTPTNAVIARSETVSTTKSISMGLGAGTFVIGVFANEEPGSPSSASYTLEVR